MQGWECGTHCPGNLGCKISFFLRPGLDKLSLHGGWRKFWYVVWQVIAMISVSFVNFCGIIKVAIMPRKILAKFGYIQDTKLKKKLASFYIQVGLVTKAKYRNLGFIILFYFSWISWLKTPNITLLLHFLFHNYVKFHQENQFFGMNPNFQLHFLHRVLITHKQTDCNGKCKWLVLEILEMRSNVLDQKCLFLVWKCSNASSSNFLKIV